jgi:2-polyprenyl-3-methyl-5-hydroxy-6-metoxy-1,4-benzoquinol methylase
MTHLPAELRQRILDENRKHYNSVYADEYDAVHSQGEEHYSQRLVREHIQQIIQGFDRTFSVLDFGCGTGNLTVNFMRLSSESCVTAVDIAQRILDKLAERLTPTERNRIEFVALEIDSFAEAKRCFDVICCSGTLHHLPDYVASVLKITDNLRPKVIYFALEPRLKNRISKIGAALNFIDTRLHFCMVDLKLEGLSLPIRWLKFLKSLAAHWLGNASLLRWLRQHLQKSKIFSMLYYEGKYNSSDAMKYVEFHGDGVDEEALRQVLEDRGYQVSIFAGADKHYGLMYRLSRLFNAPSHFTLIATK